MDRIQQWWDIHSAYGTHGRLPWIARRVQLINKVGLLLGILGFCFVVVWLIRGNIWMTLSNLAIGLLLFITPWLNKKGWVNLSRYSILFFLTTFIFFF